MAVINDRVPLIGSERRIRKGQTLVGPADAHERLSVTVQLRRRPDAPDLPDLEAIGRERPSRRRPVDREALMAALGADQGDLEKVKQFARHHKLKVEEAIPERRTVRLSGTVEQFDRAFAVQLKQYREGEFNYRSRQGSVFVPRHLQGIVERVSGLTDRPLATAHNKAMPKIPQGVTAQQVAQLYDFPQGVDCSQQNIALIELGGGYNQDDLDTYFGTMGLTPPNVVTVGVDGADNNYG